MIGSVRFFSTQQKMGRFTIRSGKSSHKQPAPSHMLEFTHGQHGKKMLVFDEYSTASKWFFDGLSMFKFNQHPIWVKPVSKFC